MQKIILTLILIVFSTSLCFFFTGKGYAVDFSSDEQEWLNQEHRLRFSEVEWPPLSHTDEFPIFKGIIADYLEIISSRSGIKFVFIKSKSWQDVQDKFVNNEIDLIPALSKNDSIGAEVLLTNSYISFPLVIVTRPEVDFIGYTHELDGKKVGVGEGYTSYHYLNKNYPGIKLKTTENVLQGLKMVEKGEIGAFVGHLAVMIYTITHSNIDVKIAGKTEFDFKHRIGLSPKHAQVATIINKILAGMSEEEHNNIYNKWVKINVNRIDYSLVWKILIGTGLVLLGVTYWNRKLSVEKRRVQKANNDLNILKNQLEAKNVELSVKNQELTDKEERYKSLSDAAFEGIIISDNGKILEVNKTMANMLGYSTTELISKNAIDFVIPENRDLVQENILSKHEEPYEISVLKKDGSSFPIAASGKMFSYRGKQVRVSAIRDLTGEKKAEKNKIDKERLQGVVEMAGTVCHELNQPLQNITGYSDLILANIDSENDIYKKLLKIKKQIERIASITKQLMNITRYKTRDYVKGEKIIDLDKSSKKQNN